jgi:hypothetical protein
VSVPITGGWRFGGFSVRVTLGAYSEVADSSFFTNELRSVCVYEFFCRLWELPLCP